MRDLEPTDDDPGCTRVVVVGGGASGVITARHLLRNADADHPVEVHVVEERPEVGPGLAYRTEHPLHTLNNFAARLSAVDGDPDHLLRWCAANEVDASPTAFLPRATYGRYLTDVLRHTAVPPGSTLRRVHDTVTDVRSGVGGVAVALSGGTVLAADVAVLALGNPPPRRRPDLEALGTRYLGDPWAPDLVERVAGAREVLLVGTGLTMVDVVAALHAASPGTRFTAVSRHGLLPLAHKRGSSRLHDVFHPGTTTLDALVESVRARISEVEDEGGDWRDVVDSVRACANDLWQGLSPSDQEWFVGHVARRWEIARHRMSPEMAGHIRALQDKGTLRVATVDQVDPRHFDRVVNCTGPMPVPTPGWNPLVDSLLERGAVRAHRLGLGLDVDRHGRVIGTDGRPDPRLFVVGAARRGAEWEVAAVPDLRSQAARLADLVVGPAARTSAGGVTRDLGSAWSTTPPGRGPRPSRLAHASASHPRTAPPAAPATPGRSG